MFLRNNKAAGTQVFMNGISENFQKIDLFIRSTRLRMNVSLEKLTIINQEEKQRNFEKML